jgi:hypothetical protein
MLCEQMAGAGPIDSDSDFPTDLASPCERLRNFGSIQPSIMFDVCRRHSKVLEPILFSSLTFQLFPLEFVSYDENRWVFDPIFLMNVMLLDGINK